MQPINTYSQRVPENVMHFRNFAPDFPYQWHQVQQPNWNEHAKNKVPKSFQSWRPNGNYRYHVPEDKKEGEKDVSDWDQQYDNASAAFLGPQLWEKTIPCHSDLKFEYMDLDEFLNENDLEDEFFKKNLAIEERSNQAQHEVDDLLPSIQQGYDNTHKETSTSVISPPIISPTESRSPDPVNPTSPITPNSPLSPVIKEEEIGHDFDPRTRTFSEDELKPVPMVKKSRKQYVPSDLKDDKYWARRRKNNLAAKRSRDARRIKENQIALRAGYLEKENNALKMELEKTRGIVDSLKKRLATYESTNGIAATATDE